MISYDTITTNPTTIRVTLDGKRVGIIYQQFDSMWQYFPKGSKDGGDKFPTLALCKRSLERS